VALSMLYNGAGGATRTAMADALQLKGMNVESLNKASSALIANLNSPGPGIRVRVANAIWAGSGDQLKPDFMDINKRYYGARVSAVDFTDPATVGKVNAWVRDKTAGRIPQIVSAFDPLTILCLTNAVYFDGAWMVPFERSETKEADFTLADGNRVRVPMMTQNEAMYYVENDEFRATYFPYSGLRFRMYVFVHGKPDGLAGFVQGLSSARWKAWLAEFGRSNGTHGLPRFTMEYQADQTMQAALKTLGMADAFDRERADFSALSTRKSWIGQVVHKTGLVVNETGTIAAAASAAMAVACVGRAEVIADRPFFCAIEDSKTGLIVFMGLIYDPTQTR